MEWLSLQFYRTRRFCTLELEAWFQYHEGLLQPWHWLEPMDVGIRHVQIAMVNIMSVAYQIRKDVRVIRRPKWTSG
jgi:hypothetical protein